MFSHVFRTWGLANLIHPVTFIAFVFIDEGKWTMTMDDVGFLFIFYLLSFLISIPSLVIARIFIYPIIRFNLSPYEKLILWIIAIFISIVLNFCGFILILNGWSVSDLTGWSDLTGFYFLIPSAIASLLAILVRIRSFFLLNDTINQLNNGNNLV